MGSTAMKIGEVARRTGITVRTLHYYEQIGLLAASRRTEASHRLYGAGDIARLQQIMSLRQLGLSLDEIRELLDKPGYSPLQTIEMHLAALKEEIELAHKLRARLEGLAAGLRSMGEVSVDELIQAMEAMKMFEKYYTPEQMEKIKAQGEKIGEGRIKEVESEWPRLMEEVRMEMEKGTDPASPRAQELARRWTGLVSEFTGNDPGIEGSLRKMYEERPPELMQHVDPRMGEYYQYIARALEAGKKEG